MTSEITRENFVSSLSKAIPDSNLQKPFLLHYAQLLLQSADEHQALALLEDPIVKRAQRLYMRCSPKKGNIPPSLPTLIKWLRSRRGLDTVQQVEKKHQKVKKYLDALGVINPDDPYIKVPVDTIIALRLLVGYKESSKQQ